MVEVTAFEAEELLLTQLEVLRAWLLLGCFLGRPGESSTLSSVADGSASVELD